MEQTIINIISNVGFPIAVSIALFYYMAKTNDTYINLLREFQGVINNNTQSINLLNSTVEDLQREMKCREVIRNEPKKTVSN